MASESTDHQSTTRFSDRVADYVKYRPGYPQSLMDELSTTLGLRAHHRVADVGSGTGIFSELLLKLGCPVVGVEPNTKMRKAGEDFLSAYPSFLSQDGTSEKTGLPDQSVDYIFAAQAFHWFEPRSTYLEFKRVLRSGGVVALIWNERRTEDTAFARDYEALIQRFATDYNQINHANLKDDQIFSFFGDGSAPRKKSFTNFQNVDFDGLLGRLASSSYVPKNTDPNFLPMKTELHALFEKNQVNGRVQIDYDTKMYWGSLQ